LLDLSTFSNACVEVLTYFTRIENVITTLVLLLVLLVRVFVALTKRSVLFGVLRSCIFSAAIICNASSSNCLRALAADSRSFTEELEILLGVHPF